MADASAEALRRAADSLERQAEVPPELALGVGTPVGEPLFRELLLELKKLTGLGVVLNTSFNVHGDPLVCSPQDALDTLRKTGNEYLIMGKYLVKNNYADAES